MRLYEFEGKQLFAEAKIPTPPGKVVSSPAEAAKAAAEIGFPVVLKSQVLTGGRGKAGGIQFAENEAEAKAKAQQLFKLTIKGFPVEKASGIVKECAGTQFDPVMVEAFLKAQGEGGIAAAAQMGDRSKYSANPQPAKPRKSEASNTNIVPGGGASTP